MNKQIPSKYSLKYFILNTNTLILYREILKYTKRIRNHSSKLEIRAYIKSEFRRDCLMEYDEGLVEYKLGVGRKKINEFKYQIDLCQ